MPPVLSSKDRLIKEPKDFTCCEEVGLRIPFNVLILGRYRKSSRKAVLDLSLIVQYKKKCASSSTTPHFSHSLKCLGILLYRPFSMPKEWSLTLSSANNLQNLYR